MVTASVIGLGKAGLPLAAVMADSGINVIGMDINSKRVDDVNNGINPIPGEKGLQELFDKHSGKSLTATTSLSEAVTKATHHIIIVPVFIDENKDPDFGILTSVLKGMVDYIKDDDVIVLETTLPPGTTASLAKKILDGSRKRYHLAYSPERIMTGVSISRFKAFPKVVGGVSEEAGLRAYEFYKRFSKISLVSNATTAEMIKVSEGIYRDVAIGLSNELFTYCNKIGLDYCEIKKHANHDYCHLLNAGIGVGGHCIPVYPWFVLKKDHMHITRAARKRNDEMIEFWKDKLNRIVAKRGLAHPKVLVKHIVYRKGVKAHDFSRSKAFVDLLKQSGYDVYVYDEMHTKEEIEALGYKWSESGDIIVDTFGEKGVDIHVNV